REVRRKAMRQSDLFRMMDEAVRQKERYHNPRELAMLMFVAETAARPGEVASLRLDDLDLERLEATVNGKTGKRTVVFSRHTAQALADWLEMRRHLMSCWKKEHDYVFVSIGAPTMCEPIGSGSIYQIFKRTARR